MGFDSIQPSFSSGFVVKFDFFSSGFVVKYDEEHTRDHVLCVGDKVSICRVFSVDGL